MKRPPLNPSSGANSISIVKLIDIPHADGSIYNGVGVPGITVDTKTGIIYFTTKTVNGQGEGGIFWINPTNSTHTIHTIWQQTGTAGTFIGNGILQGIEVDDATGKYYVTVLGSNGEGGAVYVGNLSDNNVQPTLFETMPTFSSGTIQPGSQGFSIDNAPTLTGIVGTSTEAVQHGAAVTLLTGAPVAADTDNDKLASATVTITNFQTGDVLAATLTGNITIASNSNGTLTLTGTNSLADYESVLASITYKDNGTDGSVGSHPTRTITWTVSDGLLSSAADSTTLTIDRPPVVTTHNAALLEGGTATGSVTDTDLDNDTVTITGLTGGTLGTALNGAFGSLTFNTNGSYSYTASNTTAIDAAATGSHPIDTFTYTVSDGNGGVSTELWLSPSTGRR